MHIRNQLSDLCEKISRNFPKLPENQKPSIEKDKIRLAIISDIQARLAEVYGLLQREIQDADLEVECNEAIAQYPERMQTIITSVTALALAAKTKLNINLNNRVFTKDELAPINNVCFDCYKIEFTLKGISPDQHVKQVFENGIVNEMSYKDYKSGFARTLRPGSIPGQIMSNTIGTSESAITYQAMIKNARESLDTNYKYTKDQIYFKHSSSKEFSAETDELFNKIFSQTKTAKKTPSPAPSSNPTPNPASLNDFSTETEAMFKGMFSKSEVVKKSASPKAAPSKQNDSDEQKSLGGKKPN